ncbi:MAG: hypothetical protein AABX39_01590, partial [Nanoarchaeota archaeon]
MKEHHIYPFASLFIVLSFVVFSIYVFSQSPQPTISGMVTGTANFTITSTVSIVFRNNSIDFGAGTINDTSSGTDNCTMDTTGGRTNASCATFVQQGTGFKIENNGNINATLSANFDKAAVAFLGSSGVNTPIFTMKVSNSEATSCANLNGTFTGFANVPTAATVVCNTTTFNFADTRDLFLLDINIS